MMTDKRILISGAGPVGYTTALNLARYGIPFTLFEAGADIFEDPRAGTIHPPTLEMFDESGVTKKMLEQGYLVPNYHYRDRKQGLIVDFPLEVLKNDTHHPYRIMLEQHKLSHILREQLKAYSNYEILNNHRVARVSQDADGVNVVCETPHGEKTFRGTWLIGCDGGRSQVRKSMNVKFEGFTWEERFLVLSTRYDFGPHGFALTNYIADPTEWCALFKVPGYDGKGLWRILFPAEDGATQEELFDEASIQRRIQGFHAKDGTYEIYHRNLYEVHQRVASSYRDGRLLLAGDAAHINNPLGGMGMNFGLHDSFNLTAKLAKIWHDGASHDLLDLYDRQRRTVAQEYLQRQTIENKKNIEQKDPAAREAFYDELRGIRNDPAKLHSYLLRVAMIEGIRRSNSIT
jgi:3-(3-hydroxy-phenyl)propionate hydroxylase